MKHILVTGGAGFIGSHTVLALAAAGFHPVILDDFSNSHPRAVERLRALAGQPELPVIEADLAHASVLDDVFTRFSIDAVIHFAGLKAVGESVAQPLRYFRTNLGSTLSLLEAMGRHQCHRLIFSSSATVYGVPQQLPIPEDHPLSTTNPYGRTKLIIEEMLRDLAASDPRWHIALLRYFNPVGAHPSGQIGESPVGPPNNLFPCVTRVLTGRSPTLSVFGTDYPTPDGSGVRDYLHVCDLADGHLAALRHLESLTGAVPINLGTGTGHSVLEIVRLFEQVSGRPVPWEAKPRRSGDVAACYADPTTAAQRLHWRAQRSLHSMCEDAWRWQKNNPLGYETPT